MSYPAGTALRYPLIFGGILIGFSIAFLNRDKFMTGLEEERNNLLKEDLEAKAMIQETIKAANKAHTTSPMH